jgi:chromosome segregation ATPase
VPNRDFEIDMRMKADFAAARREVTGTEGDLRKLGDAAVETNDKMNKGGGGSGSENRIRDMVRRSLDELEVARAQVEADQRAAGTGRGSAATATLEQAQAQQAYVAASRATQQAISAEIGLISELQERLGRSATGIDDLADTESRLDAAMRKGLITAEEYDEALEKLGAEQDRLNKETEKAGKAIDGTVGRYDKAGASLQRLVRDEAQLKAAVDAGRISREQYNRAMATIGAERARLTAVRDGALQSANAMRTLNTASLGVQRNLSQLVSYGVTGQWQLAGNQLLQLGNQAGLAGRLFSVAGVAVGGLTLVVGGLTAALVSNYLQMRAFDNALIATGNYAGTTAGALAGMRNQIGNSTGDFAAAQTSLESLTASGKFTSESLQSASQAAVSLAQLTGKSIEDTTSQIIALAKSPTASLVELNERYHFLTLEVYENVKSLEDQGRAQDAAKVATEALAQVTASRVAQMRENAGTLERAWYDVRDAVRSAWQQIKDVGREDAEARIEAGERGILLANQRRAELQEDVRLGIISQAQADKANQALRERIAIEQKNIAQWQERKDLQDATAKAAAEEQQLQDKAVNAAVSIDRDIARIDKKAERQQRLNRLIEQYNVISVADPNDSRLYDGSYERLRNAIIKDTEEKKGPKAQKTGAQRDEEAAARELLNLQKQRAGLESLAAGETKVTEAARIRFEVTEGAYQHASAATKAQLLAQAEIIDGAKASIEAEQKRTKELEETKRSYEQLQDALRTPTEAALEGAIAQVETLNKALKSGIADSGAYDQSLGRIVSGSFDQAPKFAGLAPEIGGAFGELGKIGEARAELEKWYQDQLVLLSQFRSQKIGVEAQWNAQEQALTTQHQNALRQIESARQQAMLVGASATFGQLADIAKAYGGEQSKTYQAIFAISKAFAVAQAAVALAQNVAEASKAGFPQNIGFIAGALAQGAQIASLLSQANFSGGGFADGGWTGPGSKWEPAGIVHAEEFVNRREVVRQPGARAFLEDFNRRGMEALYGWRGYADGGFVEPAVRVAEPRWEKHPSAANGGLAPTVNANTRVLNFIDVDQLVQALATSSEFERTLVNGVVSNGNSIRAGWQE